MKQEEMSDMCTILVEGQDERAEVMDQVRKQHKPVVIVVPEYASQIFQRPEDFRDLKRVKRECGIPVTLVLPGHERMRNWARRQGFTVYASSETCARALARRDRLNALRGIWFPGVENWGRLTLPLLSGQDDDEEDDALWSWETEEPPDEEDMPGASSSRSATPENDKSDEWDAMTRIGPHPFPLDKCGRDQSGPYTGGPYVERAGTAWRITGNGWEMAWSARERTTDGIVPLGRQEQVANDEFPTGKIPTRRVSGREPALPLDLTQLVPTIKSGAVDRGEETPTTEPLYEHWTDQHEKVIPPEAARGHTLVLMLTALLILGLLGGIGFGYVLSLLHAGLGALHLLFL